jgi:uncharacterized paraquat-inducible protein A
MATCAHCQTELDARLAYCPRCRARTPRARRIINLALRFELLLLIGSVTLIVGSSMYVASHS